VLTPAQRDELQKLRNSQKAQQRLVLRARIIWLLAQAQSVTEVATELNICTKTVIKWRDRFAQRGMEALEDAYRSGAPPRFTVGQRLEVMAMACAPPEHYGVEGYTRWTYDLLTECANAHLPGLGMSRSSIFRTLKEVDLKPHKLRMWLHSPDPEFREKVNVIVDLYHNPPAAAVVLSVDEKSGMQATERKHATQYPLPAKPGRYEYEYTRHGTQSLLTAFNVQTGAVTASCGDRRGAQELLAFMEQVAEQYHYAPRIIIIWDNLNIHYDGTSQRWSQFNQRHGAKFTFIYTPLHASWVNQVEIFFAILQKRCLKHGSFTSILDLRQKVLAFIRRWNEQDGHAFNWTFRGYPLQSRKVA